MSGIGAKDHIDMALVSKYANLQTNNMEDVKQIPTSRMWDLLGMAGGFHQQQMLVEYSRIKKKVNNLAKKAEEHKKQEPKANAMLRRAKSSG